MFLTNLARVVTLSLPLALLVGACGSSGGSADGGPAGGTMSCATDNVGNIPGTDACTDYTGGWGMAAVMQLCSTPGARFSATACVKSNRIGGCSGTLGTLGYTRWYYPRTDATTPATSADVMADCASMTDETFTAP